MLSGTETLKNMPVYIKIGKYNYYEWDGEEQINKSNFNKTQLWEEIKGTSPDDFNLIVIFASHRSQD